MKFIISEQQIKYDELDRQVGLAVAIAGTIGFFAAFAMIFFQIGEQINTSLVSTMIIGGIYGCPWMMLIGWKTFFGSIAYKRRLEKYGYKFPERKKQYHDRLDLLERFEVSLPDVNKWHPESMSLALVAWLAGVCSLPYPFYVWQCYPDMDGILMIMLFPVVCWGIMGLYYWKQRDQLRFKDDVEQDEMRKTRQNLSDGLVTILLCAFLTVAFYFVIYNLAKIIYILR